MNPLYLHREGPLPGGRHFAPPCFYGSQERTKALERMRLFLAKSSRKECYTRDYDPFLKKNKYRCCVGAV